MSEYSLRGKLPSATGASVMTSIEPTTAAPNGRGGGDGPSGIIRTFGLTKQYAGTDFKAVDGLDLDIAQGEIFGLLGPNGAGKTTTVGVLTTRVIATEGEAFIGEIDVIRHPALAKQLSGVVSQTNTLDRQLDVFENLYFHGLLFGVPAKESRRLTSDLLERFHLAKWAKASIYALSGGMAQRLMVARAIMHRPAVLFLDEPTAGLDPQSRIALWELMGELHADGHTILLTTHYMEEADQLCDRVAIMDHGRILALDTPERLKAGVGADRVVTVSGRGETAGLADVLARMAGATHADAADGEVRVYLRGVSGVLPRVVDAAEAAGFTVTDLSINEPTLETVFITLTGKD